MDPDDEIETDWPPYFRLYKSGRVERLIGTSFAPPSSSPAAGVASKDVTIDPETPISARLYLPFPTTGGKKLPVLVYFHGGGFCVESASSPTYQPFLSSLSSSAGLLAVSVNYRLAPEHKLPAAYDDAWAALEWALSPRADTWISEHGDPTRVFLAGDSAGANIAHHMAMRAGAGARIEGVVLIHPCFWGSGSAEAADPAVAAWMGGLWRLVGPPGAGSVDHPWLNPTAEGAPSLAGLGCRRVMVCVAEECPMTGAARAYCEALRGSGWGGEVEVFESEGEGHVFHLDAPESEKAAEVVERVAAFIRKDGVA